MKTQKTVTVWILWILFILGGCVYGEYHHITGEPFSEQALRGIKQRTMTRRDVLQWFGPPIAIARRGTTMTFPPATVGREGWEEIQSDTFFELFSQEKGHADDHIIYYYYTPRITSNIIISLVGSGTQRIVTDELWVLIDERTGRAEDFVLRTGKKEAAAAGIGGSPTVPRSDP